MMDRATQLLIILLIEAAIGYPQWLYRIVRHPVVWIGSLITVLERRWNAGSARSRTVAGCALLLVLLLIAGGAGTAFEWMSRTWPSTIVLLLLAATTMLAQHSLHVHVADVLRPLAAGDVEAARLAVSKIVGRDTAALDSEGISAAAIESLSESFCDGIVAPAFWFLVAGLPGLFICKAINTADSMIGHRDDRYRAFGWAAARVDDLVNLVPARIAGFLICLVGFGGVRTMLRDARRHASPNGGWPEAAMAGVLARQLGGPVSYDGESAFRAHLGAGPRPDAESLRSALAVFWRACLVLWLIVAGVAWLQ
jgi:adenosylcobinamide-phosphate synthase